MRCEVKLVDGLILALGLLVSWASVDVSGPGRYIDPVDNWYAAWLVGSYCTSLASSVAKWEKQMPWHCFRF